MIHTGSGSSGGDRLVRVLTKIFISSVVYLAWHCVSR